MASPKPSIPKGTRDFGPAEMLRRNYIFDTIRQVFQCYGFLPIETPSMENLSTLLGKYGDEGDKLLFKILNSGDFLKSAGLTTETGEWKGSCNSQETGLKIAEKGLRYDLTVPFARFVVQHRNDITFPFKRYQIQPVWRADRPQKGRYREFCQCDVDVIGSTSLLNEVELIIIIDDIFTRLRPGIVIHVNNRKVLAGIAESIGEPDNFSKLTVALDKLDKIGPDSVRDELRAGGIGESAIEKLEPVLEMKGTNEQKLERLAVLFSGSETGMQGLEEIRFILGHINNQNLSSPVDFEITLARGLNYYTGTILEVKALDVSIGSLCGGGRYDDLTGVFGLPGISGVGVSFGADRIYDVLQELDLFPEGQLSSTRAMLVNFGSEEAAYSLDLLKGLRKAGIPSELYPDNVPLKKQFSYADHKQIPYVVIAGSEEIAAGQVLVKEMKSGEQSRMDRETLCDFLTSI